MLNEMAAQPIRHRYSAPTRLVALILVAAFAGCGASDDQPDPRQTLTADRPATASHTRGQTPGVKWTDPVTVAEGPARKGPWRMNDSIFHYVDDPPVDITDGGKVGLAWVDNETQTVRYQAFDADHEPMLDQPSEVSRSPETFSWLPRIVMTGPPSDHVYVLWQEIIFSGGSHGGEAFFARSTDGGATFGEPINLSNTEHGVGKGRLTEEIWHNGSLDLARGPDGTLYAAWTAYQGPLHVTRSMDDGKTFSKPVRVAGSQQTPARAPALAIADEQTVYLAWTVGESEAADLRLATSNDGGASFGRPSVILDSGAHSDAPKLEVDSQGTLHLVYGESPAGMFERYHVRYARKGPDAASFGQSRRISSADDGTESGANFPSLALDGRDNLFVLWNGYPAGTDRPLGLGFTASFDRGRTFVAPSIVPGSTDPALGFNGSLQGMLMRKLAANASGELAAVNSRFKPDVASRIRLYRGTAEPR